MLLLNPVVGGRVSKSVFGLDRSCQHGFCGSFISEVDCFSHFCYPEIPVDIVLPVVGFCIDLESWQN